MTDALPPHWSTALGPLPLQEPLFLGILNATPDSFSDGGRFLDPEAALAQARRLLAQGAGVLDVGAESTRPGAAPVGPEQEWARLEPVLLRLRAELPGLPLSLDTRNGAVAARGLQAGVAILNDVTGFRDPELLHVARNSGCGLIAMRSRMAGGTFSMPPYGLPGPPDAAAATGELLALKDRLLAAGIAPERLLLDPGFGFGTTFTEDLALWEALPRLPGALDWPAQRFCVGISRKRFLAWRAGTPALPAQGRDGLTARAHREAEALGYRVFRSHTGPVPAIRAATPEDAEALAAIQVASWRAAYRDVIPGSILDNLATAPLAQAFLEMLTRPPSPQFRLWLLSFQDRPAGYAATGPCRDEGADPAATAEVHALYFLKETWGLGLGGALLARALESFRERGFRDAALWVLERNTRARRFYEAQGWVQDGAPRTIWQDGIALREQRYRLELG
jgi:dihydropteroate synthase